MKIIALMLLVLCSGCAGQTELRSVSSKSAVILSDYRDHFADFAARQSTLNQANAERLQQLEAMRNKRLAEINTRRLAWDLAGDEVSLKRLNLASSVTPDQILATGGVLNPAPGPIAVKALEYDPAAVNVIIKNLDALREEIGILQRAEELLAFGSAVRKAINEDVEKASNDTDVAASETAAAASKTAAQDSSTQRGSQQ